MVLSPNSALRENLPSEGEETTVADAQHQVEHQADDVSTDIPLEATASNDHGQEIDENLTDGVSTCVSFESTGSDGHGQEAEASESSSHGQQGGSLSLRASESGNHDQQDNEVSMEVIAADRHSQQPDTAETLERYQQCCFTPQKHNFPERQTQNWSQEVIKLKAKYEEMERTQRHLLGEDLGPLNLKELQNLEKQLEGALSLARQRKTQIMMELMEDLRKKERQLGELNKQLKSKLDAEGQSLKTIQSLWGSSTAAESSDFALHLSHPNPMECDHEPVLQIGYQHYVQAEGSSVSKSMGGETSFIHGWVI
ncbi:hypothetical protein V6N12_066577 [Hibiscus sabdariffa]|uniref:K-box domain-containing protein n=1 Tax=Hibiscus sabdariffa TaxID=183260 RepID=A0ABR2CQI5_9ROSI